LVGYLKAPAVQSGLFCRGPIFQAMLRPAYLSKKLARPLSTKDGGTLRTVAEARTYMLGLSTARELRAQWQRTAELLLAEADVGAFLRAKSAKRFLGFATMTEHLAPHSRPACERWASGIGPPRSARPGRTDMLSA
jgi:hypothetical protein